MNHYAIILNTAKQYNELGSTVSCKQPCFSGLSSTPPSAAYMCQWIGSALIQIMACRLFDAKPLSKPILGYCQLDAQEQT